MNKLLEILERKEFHGVRNREREAQTSILGNETPIASAVFGDVGRELVVFFGCPLSSFDAVLLTTGYPTHYLCFCLF